MGRPYVGLGLTDSLSAALQVVELPREGPEAALKLFGGLPNLRLLVIGGDGTVAWILSCIDSIQVCCTPFASFTSSFAGGNY